MEASENSNMASNVLVNMQKSIILILLLGAGFSLSAQDNSNISIFIPPVTGIGNDYNDNAIIAKMLANEVKARNCVLVKIAQKADLILYGTLAPYHEEEQYYHDYVYLNTKDDDTPASVTTYTYNSLILNSPKQPFIFQLILKNEKTDEALLVQNLLYHSIDEVYDFFPLLIYNIFFQINGEQIPVKYVTDDWANKWLYLRTSFDFPITFYLLQGKGLIAGIGVYDGTYDKPTRSAPLDNIVVALPAMTWGAELQLFNWLSIEPNFQIGWEYLNSEQYVNMAVGFQLKFPLKFIRNVMMEPYGAVLYPVYSTSSPSVFDKSVSSPVALGGGFQLSVKGGQPGAAFIDINYMYYCFGDVGIKNNFDKLFPLPKTIHYQRSIIGLGVGYKFGVFNRNKNQNSE
ncbi:MAG: hypothetical protein LBH20_00325 [Treponema sp.]|jgi:hypothetical protein|nr:hypothetical protein [Treponema sp.]